MLSDPKFVGQKRRRAFGGKRHKKSGQRIIASAERYLCERGTGDDVAAARLLRKIWLSFDKSAQAGKGRE